MNIQTDSKNQEGRVLPSWFLRMVAVQLSSAISDQVKEYRRIAQRYLEDEANPRLRYLAISYYQQALALEPDNAWTLLLMADAYQKLGKLSEALTFCEAALAAKPDFIEAQVRLCRLQLPLLHERAEDIEQCRQNYHACLLKLASLVDSLDSAGMMMAARGAITFVVPLLLAYQGYDVRELQTLYGAQIGKVVAAAYPQWLAPPLATPPASGERLRIGLVSHTFHNCQHWRMNTKGWLSQLDRERFTLYCYSIGSQVDEATDEARQLSENFVTGEHSFEDWCAAIRHDRLHVLIYMELTMTGLGERLAGLRLAPVQCTTWAFPITSGLTTIDYYLGSDLAEPPGAEAHYTETLVRLPNLSTYIEPDNGPVADDSRADLGLRDNAIVYLCDQWLLKYLPQHDDIYPRIASAVPNCQFVFNDRFCLPWVVKRFQQRMKHAFAAYGLNWEDFVVLRPYLSLASYRRLCQLCDVYLDSLEFSGVGTTIEAAIAHNLPVVTLAGQFARGRQGLAIMRRMEISSTIATNPADYVALAVRLGNDADFRHLSAQQIAENKHKLYYDHEAIAGLEEFLKGAVCSALSPEDIPNRVRGSHVG